MSLDFNSRFSNNYDAARNGLGNGGLSNGTANGLGNGGLGSGIGVNKLLRKNASASWNNNGNGSERERGGDASLGNTGHIFTTMLFAAMVVCMLLALIAGTNAYKALYDLRADTNSLRTSQSLIINSIHAADATDCVAVAKGPEGKALVLIERDGDETYETRIYLYQGNIVQEYALANSAYTPDKALALCPSNNFDFSYSKGTLTIVTDHGEAFAALRSVRGGA